MFQLDCVLRLVRTVWTIPFVGVRCTLIRMHSSNIGNSANRLYAPLFEYTCVVLSSGIWGLNVTTNKCVNCLHSLNLLFAKWFIFFIVKNYGKRMESGMESWMSTTSQLIEKDKTLASFSISLSQFFPHLGSTCFGNVQRTDENEQYFDNF